MDEKVHASQLWTASKVSLGAGLESICHTDFLLVFATSIVVPTFILFLDVLHRLFSRALRRLRNMQEANIKPFPFERLPQELRDMVYKNLLDDVPYPTIATTEPAASFNGMLTSLWGAATNTRSSQTRKSSNWIFLANKQIYTEYMDMHCKHSLFNLTVSPSTYQLSDKDTRIWPIAPSILSQVRNAHLEIITTSAMLGCTDPRAMTSSSWTLAAQIRSSLSKMTSCMHLTLESKAIGDPLWNPLWIWYHSSQSFKNIGTELSDVKEGPKLDKLTFSLDTWSPGENYLQRDNENKGVWTWYCMEGHSVGVDGGAEQTVREFCGMLYRECRTCRPTEEDDEGEE